MFDDFDGEREHYENDLEELGQRESWEDAMYEREDHNWDGRDEDEPEDRYLDSSYEGRYYESESGYDYL